MKITDFTGFILPVGSVILASLTLFGQTWAGHVLIPFSIGVVFIELLATVVIYNTSSNPIDYGYAALEIILHLTTAGILLFSGWITLSAAFSFTAIMGAGNAMIGWE